MENYDVDGTILKGKKAVIAVVIPPLSGNNFYGIYDIYNISDEKENKIVIHFKDLFGKPLVANDFFESFVIDLSDKKFLSIDFTRPIKVAFHHENGELKRPIEDVYRRVFDYKKEKGKDIPDTTGRGTIREGAKK